MDVLKNIEEWWLLISSIVSGIFVAIVQWRKSKRSSRVLLEKKMEDLRLKVISNIEVQLKHKVELAEQKYLIELLKNRCPKCYNECLEIIKNELGL